MIHLDRSSKQNIIQDHHKILSWSPISHDDHPFNPDDFLSDTLTAVEPDDLHLSSSKPPFEQSTISSPPDGADGSTTRDRSSSLSPAPESNSPIASPPPPPAAEEKEAPALVPQREEEEEDDDIQPMHPSGQSTPLSELSPPPDQDDDDDVPDNGKPEDDTKATGSENVILDESGGQKDQKTDVMNMKATDQDINIASSPRASTDAVTSESKPTHDSNPGKFSSSKSYMASSSTPRLESPSRAISLIQSPTIPSATLSPTTPSEKSDPKVVSILELNSELLKICIHLQDKGVAITDMKFQQYSSRLQSNLTWLAAAADHSRNHLNMLLPNMDPPPPIEFFSTDRIRQIYSELPSIFAKEIARRSQISPLAQNIVTSPSTPLKRERSDEAPVDIAMKRRNTGDSKSPSQMMPPPSSIPSISQNSSTHFSLPMSNGTGVPLSAPPPPASPQLSEAQMASINPSVMNTAEAQLAASNRERARQAQIRAAHQQQAARQMSPPSIPAQQQMHGGPASNINPSMNVNMNMNAAAGPSNSSNMPNINGVPDTMVRMVYNILRTPDHPFVRYMHRNVPNFQMLPPELQVQRMIMTQNMLQTKQQEQQNQQGQMGSQPQPQRPGTAGASLPNSMNAISGMPMQNNHSMPGGQFPGPGSNPVSPIPPQQSPMMHQSQQNPMFTLSGNPGQTSTAGSGIDPRMMMSSGGNMNMNNLSSHQRQLMMMQQQQQQPQQSSRFPGNSAPPNQPMMNMNPMSSMNLNMNQQQGPVFAAQQQQQRMVHAGSPTHASPGTDGQGFPVLRSNSTIPGIARSTRSPSEGAPSPMTPRGPPARGSSHSQEEYQRMMIQQQQAQAQAVRGMSSPVYNHQQQQHQQHQQQQHGQWPQNQGQNQNQNQQVMQMNMGMGQQGTYGMSPPGSAGGGHYGGGSGGGVGGSSAPSPSNSQNQNWLQSQGNYPFAPSPGAGGGAHHSDHMQASQIRHMSATPGPQQMASQNMNSPNLPSPAEQPMPHDFDLFNWA